MTRLESWRWRMPAKPANLRDARMAKVADLSRDGKRMGQEDGTDSTPSPSS